ncbi:MAG: hypothetical protein GX631_05450, partial [Dehalococcoidales bacterium]|nr:hypothetical protein [Dehalococcoidales bacterium]
MKCIRVLSVLLASVLFLSMLTGCEEIEKLADEFDIESITSGEKTADTDTPGGTSQSGSESLPGTDTPSGRPWESIDCSLSTLPDPPGDSGGMTGWALMDNPAPDARYDKALRLVQGTSAHIFALGDAGTLLRLDSTPDRWTLLETPSENNLRDMAATGGWYSMIVGDRGTVMRYDLAIGEVKDFEGPFDEWGESDRPDLYAVWGESSENFYIIGDGVFYHYARRKSSDPDYDPTHPEPVWQRLTPPVEPTKYSPYTPRISDVWFWNTNCVVLLIHDPTGRHYTMKWDGSAWREEREIPSSSLIRSIWGLGPDDIFAVGVGASVYHYDGIEWTEYNT